MKAVVLCQTLPYGGDSGCKLALLSDLAALSRLGLEIEVFAYAEHGTVLRGPPPYPTTCVPLRSGNRAARLLRSLVTQWPAAAERYYSGVAAGELRGLLRRARPGLVIVEEVTLGGWGGLVRESLPNATLVLRSHVFMHDACRSQLDHFPGMLRPILERERQRWCRMETDAVACADAVWAITPEEARRYRDVCGNVAGYVPVAIDAPRHIRVPT